MSAPTRPTDAQRRSPAALTGAAALARHALRRDRTRLALWGLGIAAFTLGSAASLAEVFGEPAARASRAELMANPTFKAFRAPGYGLEDYTVGAMVANELLVFAMLAAALASLLTVIRHTRAEEEAGRAELVRSLPLGRHAHTAAALGVAAAANLALAALLAVSLAAPLGDLDWAGAWSFGLATAAVGLVFAGVGAVAAQATEHGRTAAGAASAALGAAYVLRAVGDAGGIDDRALSWASPLGWAQSARPFVDERWWPLGLCLAAAALLAALAVGLERRRDVDASLLRPRPGPARATDRLVSPFGLAWRLQRGALAGWAVAAAALGAVFGAVIGEIDAFLADNPQLAEVFGDEGTLTDAFLATVVLLVALLAVGATLASALRPRAEEADGRAEPLLVAAASRVRWLAAHVAVAAVGGAAVMLAGGAGIAVAATIDQRDAALLAELLGAGAAYVPALWLLVGLAAALYGWAPRAAGAVWLLLAHAAVVGLLGDVLELPEWLRALSPLHHVPALPAERMAWAPLAALAVLAAVLAAAGALGLRRRGVPEA